MYEYFKKDSGKVWHNITLSDRHGTRFSKCGRVCKPEGSSIITLTEVSSIEALRISRALTNRCKRCFKGSVQEGNSDE